MTAAVRPTWFGDPPMLGWWQVPEGGTARASVLICPSIGQEYTSAYRTLRFLAERLAEHGFAVLRFDYPGTGDSADPPGDPADPPGGAAAWLSGIHQAIAHARTVVDGPVAAVGLRLGAVILEQAIATDPDIAAAVLWDPPSGGRAWIRRQTGLALLGSKPAATADGVIEVPGATLAEADTETVSSWTLPAPSGASVRPRLLLTPRGPSLPKALAALADGDAVTWQEVEGQATLVEVDPVQAKVPAATLAVIADWLSGMLPRERVPVTAAGEATATLCGGALRETAGRFGARGVAGVITEPAAGASGRTVLLLGASEHRVGPARQWVRWARRWAARYGVRCVRLDIGGTGDGDRHGDELDLFYYTGNAVADAADAIRSLADEPGSAAVVGLCAGAWTAMRAAEDARPGEIYLINQTVWGRGPYRLAPWATVAPPPPVRMSGLRGALRRAIPAAVGNWLDEAQLTNSPIARMAALSRLGVGVTVVLGGEDVAGFETLAGAHYADRLAPGGRRGRLLRRRGRLRVVEIPGLDHAMVTRAGRVAADSGLESLLDSDLPG